MDAGRGALMGAARPLSSSRVLSLSAALKDRGAGPALILAFLFATPELGIETLVLSVHFLGWEFAGWRLLTAISLAFFASLMVTAVATRAPQEASALDGSLSTGSGQGSWGARAVRAFDELFHHVGAWMILGIVGAALLEVALPESAFDEVNGWFAQFAVISLIAVPSYVCAPAATPLAAVLLAKGLSPGAVLVGLLLGPVTNVATMTFLRHWFGMKAAVLGAVTVVSLSWACGLILDTFWAGPLLSPATHDEPEHGVVFQVAALVSGILLLRAVFSSGVRGFLSTLEGDHGHGGEGHGAHGNAHGQNGEEHGGHGHADGHDRHSGDSHHGHSH